MENAIRYFFMVLLLAVSCTSSATVHVPHFFSSNMVLQRDKIIKVWGTAESGEAVSIDFNGIFCSTIAGVDGVWRVEFPSMSHGGALDMTIKCKDNTLILKNILIGDVWLCSGQSNMEFPLGAELTANEAVKAATNSQIRLLTIPMSVQLREVTDVSKTQWLVCSPADAARFTAVGYFFGKQLQENLGVPIGLINASVGGTDIETWTSWEASMNNNDYSYYRGKTVEQALGFTMKDVQRFKNQMETVKDVEEKWYTSRFGQTGWKMLGFPKIGNGELANEAGIVWFRTEILLPENSKPTGGTLQLGVIEAKDRVWVNGAETVKDTCCPTNGCYQLGTGILKPGRNEIVVRVKNANFVGGVFSVSELLYLETDGCKYPLTSDWEYKPYLLSSDYGFKASQIIPNGFASLLYNGMIHPLVGFPLKGVIWYQGENNTRNAFQYQTLFPNLITDWRRQWKEELPFLWVQLASFMQPDQQPHESEWAELREAQNKALCLPRTGQVVITDIGDAVDIHPRNKKEVGIRLARIAMVVACGENKLASGPVFRKMQREGHKLKLTFTRCGGGLMPSDNNKSGSLRGFAIAGSDKQFVWAQAYIRDNKVIVFSDEVANPVAVRYGWANNPTEINLVNSDGLLASPFRSDNWKAKTEK